MEGSKRGPTVSTLQALAIASQFGVTLAVAVGLGLFVGQWLDGLLHTAFVFTLIGAFLGLASASAGAVTIYRAYTSRRTAPVTAPQPTDDDQADEGQSDR